MKMLLGLAILAVPVVVAEAKTSHVGGYMRKDGTYVPPHVRTNPNSTKLDNYSTQGVYNPNTGREGTVDPYKPTQSNPWGSPNNKPKDSSGW